MEFKRFYQKHGDMKKRLPRKASAQCSSTKGRAVINPVRIYLVRYFPQNYAHPPFAMEIIKESLGPDFAGDAVDLVGIVVRARAQRELPYGVFHISFI